MAHFHPDEVTSQDGCKPHGTPRWAHTYIACCSKFRLFVDRLLTISHMLLQSWSWLFMFGIVWNLEPFKTTLTDFDIICIFGMVTIQAGLFRLGGMGEKSSPKAWSYATSGIGTSLEAQEKWRQASWLWAWLQFMAWRKSKVNCEFCGAGPWTTAAFHFAELPKLV